LLSQMLLLEFSIVVICKRATCVCAASMKLVAFPALIACEF
jgi:hypothetical protein